MMKQANNPIKAGQPNLRTFNVKSLNVAVPNTQPDVNKPSQTMDSQYTT